MFNNLQIFFVNYAIMNRKLNYLEMKHTSIAERISITKQFHIFNFYLYIIIYRIELNRLKLLWPLWNNVDQRTYHIYIHHIYSFFILKINDEPFPLVLLQQSHADPLLPARLIPTVDANNSNEDLLLYLLSSQSLLHLCPASLHFHGSWSQMTSTSRDNPSAGQP